MLKASFNNSQNADRKSCVAGYSPNDVTESNKFSILQVQLFKIYENLRA